MNDERRGKGEMKRIFAAVLLLCLLLCGCKRIYPNEYLKISEHNAPYAYKQDSSDGQNNAAPTPEVSDYYALRSALTGFVTTGVEHGQVQMRNYRGDAEQDINRVKIYLTEEEPVCAYAIDYINLERRQNEDGWLLTVDAVYRRSVREIESILFVRGNSAALEAMRSSMTQFQNSVTVRISGYYEEDFVRSLTDYCKLHPELMCVIPEITTAVYPEVGNVRVVEVHFQYPNESQDLRNMRSEADSILSSAYNYIRYTPEDGEKLRLISGYFSSRFPYREDEENATVYSLLCEGVGSSVSYASVVNYLCVKIGLNSWIVSGTLDGEPHDWNIIEVDGICWHYDYHQAAIRGAESHPMTDAQMAGYEWDRELYPACTGAAPAE